MQRARKWYLQLFFLVLQIHEEHPDNIESLQYLEALAKELGRSSEEYTKKLEKLRRNQPAQTQSSKSPSSIPKTNC